MLAKPFLNRRTAVLLAFGAVAALTALLVQGVLNPEKASALGTVAAVENITNSQTPIAFQPDSAPFSSWTTVGSLNLNTGGSYAVFAKLGLRSYYTGGPSSVVCDLSLPNEPVDVAEANFTGAKGSNLANMTLMGLTNLILGTATGDAALSGSATVRCRVIGNGDMQIDAHHIRVIAIPVDSVTNNLGTLYHP